MASLLSLLLACLEQLGFLCFSFCFLTCLHLQAVMVSNFTISCLRLKYVLSSCETGKLYLLHEMRLNFERMCLSAINKR